MYSNSVEQLFLFAFFPEWIKKTALCEGESEPQWTADFMADFKLLDNLTLSEKTKEHINLVISVIKDWRLFLDNAQDLTAPFLRNENRLSPIWKPETHAPHLLIPIRGYSRKIQGHSGKITSLTLLPDGRLASSSSDYTIRIWDINTGEASIILEPSNVNIKALPDGCLASYRASNIVLIP